jgi:hypothetical protein
MNNTKTPPIKTDLFRFMTVRTAQLIDESKKGIFFAYHPNPKASFFLKGTENLTLQKAREKVNASIPDFATSKKSYLQIKNQHKELFAFSQWLSFNKNSTTLKAIQEKVKNTAQLKVESEIELWDNLFFQLLKSESATTQQICIQLLTANHFLTFVQTKKELVTEENFTRMLKRVTKSKLVIPACISKPKIETDNKANNESVSQMFGVNKLGIGVFRKVEQEVCCYVPGEVSYIENILAREYKERSTRSLTSTETTTEDITEVENELQSDTATTTRNELNSEIASVLANENSTSFGTTLGVSAKILGAEVDSNNTFEIAGSNSASESDTQSAIYAQEITQTAMERILQKTTSKRTTKMLQEFEENNRHGFDNREGTQHVTGVYRWVDIIYTNRLINYGKRLMIEFVVPEPAKFYKMIIDEKEKQKKKKSVKPIPPVSPKDQGINSSLDIDKEDYLAQIKPFGITVASPNKQTNISKAYGPDDDPKSPNNPDGKEEAYNYNLDFMQFGDYSKHEAVEANSNHNFDYKFNGTTNNGTYFTLKIANHTTRYDKDQLKNEPSSAGIQNFSENEDYAFTPPKKGSLEISVNIKNVWDFAVNLDIKLEMIFTEWQKYVYNEVINAYNAQVDEYDIALAEYNKEKEKTESAKVEEEKVAILSTDTCRSIEKIELQRLCIELLTKPFGIEQGKDFYDTNECKVPTVRQNSQWEEYASHVKFFEQAFEWSLMSYIFYPYYWADPCQWEKIANTSVNGDAIFGGFLQSGMARMVVPVRRGFEQAINYYIASGVIWNGGGLVMDLHDDLYLSIDEELEQVEGIVENEWETRMPTTLTIVQGGSVYLADEGLPCCHNLNENNPLVPSKAILGSKTV